MRDRHASNMWVMIRAHIVYTAEQVYQIISVACERPEDSGLPISHWSLSSFADEVIKRGNITRKTNNEMEQTVENQSY